jgi:hypothetical protein
MHNFDPNAGGFKDQVDAASGAFAKCALHVSFALIDTEPTAEDLKQIREEDSQAFAAILQDRGCYFPGD